MAKITKKNLKPPPNISDSSKQIIIQAINVVLKVKGTGSPCSKAKQLIKPPFESRHSKVTFRELWGNVTQVMRKTKNLNRFQEENNFQV